MGGSVVLPIPISFHAASVLFWLALSIRFRRIEEMQSQLKAEAPAPGKMLSQVVHEKLRAGHYSRRTEEAYLGWIRRFIKFYGGQHPRQLREPEVVAFLENLAQAEKVSASTQNQALNALVFLYAHVLEQKLGSLGAFARAQRPDRLPVVLAPKEVRLVGITWHNSKLERKNDKSAGRPSSFCLIHSALTGNPCPSVSIRG